MTHEIGKTAGDIWNLLNENGGLSVSKIKKALGEKDSTIHMAIGWLAREDQISLAKKGNAVTVFLKE
jgi:predicted transcriptional regulator